MPARHSSPSLQDVRRIRKRPLHFPLIDEGEGKGEDEGEGEAWARGVILTLASRTCLHRRDDDIGSCRIRDE